MPALVSTWYGSFVVDGGNVRAKRLVTQDSAAIAERLAAMEAGDVLADETALAGEADGTLVVHEKRLKGLGSLERQGASTEVPFDAGASGYPDALLHDALLRLAVQSAHTQFSDRDRIIVHQVRALDEIVKSANLLSERLREWYAVHAPELVGHVREHADLAKLIAETTSREAAAEHEGVTLSALGVAPPAADEAIVRTFAGGLSNLYETWHDIEARLVSAMEDVAPNLATVAGPMLGARLIAAAGGLERLALCPAGTVQTLGAENALFRHLKEGTKPPKHGLLFQYEAVNRAPFWQRGKIARALSGKILIAAKADAFGTDRTRGQTLAKEVEARIAEIQEKYPQPPARKPRGPPPGRGPGGRGPGGGGGGGGRGRSHGGGPSGGGGRGGGGPRGGGPRRFEKQPPKRFGRKEDA